MLDALTIKGDGDVEVKRRLNPFPWLQPSLTLPRHGSATCAADRALPQFLAWRRRLLVLVICLTALTAAIDTATWLVGGPQLSIDFLLALDPESEPVQQTLFGDVAELIWLLSFYAMPASALLAAGCWNRPRASRLILAAGWAASFLVPVAIALTPWGWWTVEPTVGRLPQVERACACRRRGGLGRLLCCRPQPRGAGARSRHNAGLRSREDASARGGAAGLAPGGGGPL